MTRKSKIIIGAIGLFTLVGMINTAAAHSGAEVKGIQAEAPTNEPTVEPTKVPTQIPTVIPTVKLLPTSTPVPAVYMAPTVKPVQTTTTTTTTQQTGLSNNNSYTNVDGNTVHSPAYSTTNSVPPGATAQCGDGTYSFSQNHSGTCSHHGGVSTWL